LRQKHQNQCNQDKPAVNANINSTADSEVDGTLVDVTDGNIKRPGAWVMGYGNVSFINIIFVGTRVISLMHPILNTNTSTSNDMAIVASCKKCNLK
jgi:hypothetical protein